MPSRIEDYALIGDCHTAALVARDGSIDWMCVPRFDSDACFAALLGTPDNGRWLIAPAGAVRSVRRTYRNDTLVLDTEFTSDDGVVTLTDCMLPFGDGSEVLRIVRGTRGRVRMNTEIIIRFGYGQIVPWVRREGRGLMAIAGPDMLHLHTEVPLKGENYKTTGEFTVTEGERIPFLLTWHPSNVEPPIDPDPFEALARTVDWWHKWSAGCCHVSEYREPVLRSLITLKALTYAPTGGIVAAPTTSLPEQIGGVRNWDYRFCWVRDATFTLMAMLHAGFREEATAWREWLLRAVAGKPADLQIMYSIIGERRLTEQEVGWLPGYENSRPVRIGNAAHGQFQLDVYGELMDVLYQCRRLGLPPMPYGWEVARSLFEFLETAWKKPDDGIWEVRGPRRDFTHSKVMAWVAFDRAVKASERFGREGPVERWRATRDAIHGEVCERGFDRNKNSFVQFYGGSDLDASLLMIPLVGFLPATDPRVRGTVEATERELMQDGFVQRYPTREHIDGLPPGEGAFLACTFWLADNYALLGRTDDARRLFERLLGLCNDVGLLSEEYDPKARRLVGNFPQAFSHIGLVNTAQNLTQEKGPAAIRGEDGGA
jgi:GH15 family glucan-1,4-alpha-glucosidase